MAITASEVQNTPFGKQFLVANAATLGTTFTIDSATLRLNATGPFKEVVDAGVNGIGTVAAGALTQAQARDILLSDGTSSVGNQNVPRCHVTITSRTGTIAWAADANVDGSGNPVIDLTTTAAASEIYVTVKVQHSIDR